MSEPYVCSVTYLRVRHPLVLPAFFLSTWRVTRAARRTSGYLSHRILGMPPFPFYWTLSVWESAAAMGAFVSTPEHRHAMTRMAAWGKLGKFARFTSAKRRVGWREALPHLREAEGVWTPASIYSPP